MPNLLIRALPDAVHHALKRQASLHGWSLQREIQSILASAVGDALDVRPAPPTFHVSDAPMLGKVGREEIYRDDR